MEMRLARIFVAKTCSLSEVNQDRLAAMDNLGNALECAGKFEEAAEIHRKTLKLRKQILGDNHPDTLASMENLGTALDCAGKFREAAEIHRKTLKLQKQT